MKITLLPVQKKIFRVNHKNTLETNNIDEIQKIRLPELITVTSVSGALWYALLNYILEFPNYSESPILILGLCISHYLNTVLIICCLSLLYSITVSSTDFGKMRAIKLSSFQKMFNKYLNIVWLPLIVFSILQYLLLNIPNDVSSDNWLAIVVITCLIITLLIFCPLLGISIKDILRYLASDKIKVIHIGMPIISFFAFCAIMIFASSKVEYKFDKEYYRSGENPVIILKTKGYIFKPSILSIKYDNIGQNGTVVTNNTIARYIELDPTLVKNNGGCIMLNYEYQIFGISKRLPIEVPFLSEIEELKK